MKRIIVALTPDLPTRILFIQSTSMANRMARVQKMGSPELRDTVKRLLACPAVELQVWAWRKLKEGKRKLWKPHIDRIDKIR